MRYYKILPQNGLPPSFIISRKACEDSWCSFAPLQSAPQQNSNLQTNLA